MPYRTPTVAVVGYAGAAVWFLIFLFDIGSWQFQMYGLRTAAPVLATLAAWLAWRAAWVSTVRGARRYSVLIAAAWTVMAAGAFVALGTGLFTGVWPYPSTSPVVQLSDVVTMLLVLVALLSVPVRARWSVSNIRLALDMATVLLAGTMFLWYFMVWPRLGESAFVLAMILIKTSGVLVVLFAVIRLAMGGAVEVSRRSLVLSSVAAFCTVATMVLQRALAGTPYLHLALAVWTLFIGLIIAASAVQLRDSSTGRPDAPPRQRPASLMPYAAVAAAHGLLIDALLHGLDGGSWPVIAGSVVLTVLVAVRQIIALRDNTRLLVKLDTNVQALRRAMAREQVLNDLGTALLSTTTADDVHRSAARSAAGLVAECPGARTAVITAMADDPQACVIVQAAGEDADTFTGTRLPTEMLSAELRRRLVAGEEIRGSSFADLGIAASGTPDDRAVVLLPLGNSGRFAGVLTVTSDAELPDDVVKSLRTLRTQISLALDSVSLTAELTMRAMHDPLTGLGNRAMMRERLTQAAARSRRSGRPVGVLLLDLNGFKPVNDTYGHDIGDALLKVVAERLCTSVRAGDTVARLGGDEFVVIAEELQHTDEAVKIAEKVAAALNQPVTLAGHVVHAPASIGIAISGTSPGSKRTICDADDLLRAADAAMYVAKRQGANHHLHGTALTQPATVPEQPAPTVSTTPAGAAAT